MDHGFTLVTRAEILSELARQTSMLAPGDTFYFYFAGHGWSQDGESFIGASDASSSSEGISLDVLKDSIRRLHPRAAFGFFDERQQEIRAK